MFVPPNKTINSSVSNFPNIFADVALIPEEIAGINEKKLARKTDMKEERII